MARGKIISSLVEDTFDVCGEDFLRKSCYTFLRRHIKPDQAKIGKFIDTLRKEKGLTQEKLGEKLGVTNKTISRWESGNYITLVFDYPDENFFDAPERRVQNTIMMAKAGGEPMQSAFFRRLSLIISFTRAHTSCMPCVPEYSNRLSLWGLACRSMSMPSV